MTEETPTFSERERDRFRKLLEVANSTTYDGEKEAALAAATRLAKSKGMSLHEAAGMEDPNEKRERAKEARERAKRRRDPDFGQKARAPSGYRYEEKQSAAEKERYERAMEEAVRRGLQTEEEQKTKPRSPQKRRASAGAWRSRPDFIRILLRDTKMSPREIASTVGVSINEVYKEKLLMRRA